MDYLGVGGGGGGGGGGGKGYVAPPPPLKLLGGGLASLHLRLWVTEPNDTCILASYISN